MRKYSCFGRHYLHFSCWTRKGYSIFAGLGREVRISRLALSMYRSVLLKSAPNGVIVNTDGISEKAIEMIQLGMLKSIVSGLRGEICPAFTCIV